MKNLKGMKGSFSSTENKKLQRSDLKFINGGDRSIMTEGNNCSDKQTYNDQGVRTRTLTVGECT